MAERVRQDFLHAWGGYKQYAWGHDELQPLTKSYRDWYAPTKGTKGPAAGEPGSASLLMTPVDALDTMVLMGLNDEADKARELIDTKLSFDKDIYVKNFEITIRLLGGLLSSYQLTGDKRLLDLANDLGTRLLPAFNSPTGMPYVFVNLKTGATKGVESNPAEIGSLLIEFGTLSKLTGKPVYYDKAKRALLEVYDRRSPIGLVGSSINVETGKWIDPVSHISGGIDSYYEYLLKCSILFHDNDCEQMWKTSIAALNKYVADPTPNGLWYAQVNMNTGAKVSTHYGALDAFFPAELALSGDLERAAAVAAVELQDVDNLGHRAGGIRLLDHEDHLPRLRTAAGDHRVDVLLIFLHRKAAVSRHGQDLCRQPGKILPHRCRIRRSGECRDQAAAR